jgi:hypothetical protein
MSEQDRFLARPTPGSTLRVISRLPAATIAVAALLFTATTAPASTRGTISLQPAAGPPGTVTTLQGEGLAVGRSVVVRVGNRVVARMTTDDHGAFRARLPLRGAAAITTRVAPRTRARNRFRLAPGPIAGEVVTGDGARLRWTPLQAAPGSPVHLRGAGLRPHRAVSVAIAGRVLATGRATRAGRFAATVPARNGLGVVSQGNARLPFTVRLFGNDGTAGAGAPSAPAGSTPPVSGAKPGTPAAPGELAFPIRAAFYYPWFPEAWNQAGVNPYTHFHPALGFYDSGVTATIARHLEQLRYARVQVAISSWWGQGHHTDQRLPTLLQTTRATGSPVRWAVYYEPEGWGDPSVAQLTADLTYLRDRYAADPAYLRIGGRFVVFAYGDANDSCATAERWRAANAKIGAYLVLKVVAGYGACAAQPDGWHQYAPAQRTDSQGNQAFAVSPGFWLATDSAPRLARDITCFRRAVRDMVASKARWQLITTFDEWGEGTSVEPAQEWLSPSPHGAYLDALHDDGAGPAAPAPC